MSAQDGRTPLRPKVPHAHGLILTTRRDELGVGTEGDGENTLCVASHGRDARVCDRVPDTNGPVTAPGREEVPAAAESHAENATCVFAVQSSNRPLLHHIPQANAVGAARDNERATRAEVNADCSVGDRPGVYEPAAFRVGVAVKDHAALAGLDVPHTNARRLLAGRHKRSPAAVEGETAHGSGVPVESAKALALVAVP